MSGWMYLLITVAVVYWVFRGGFRRLNAAKARGDMISYQAGSPERNWALALAHPTAYHAMQGGFACDLGGADEALAIYERITAPVLAIEASGDSLGQWWNGRYTLDEYHQRLTHVRNCRTAVVADAGHMLHHDQPEQVAQLIEAFLDAA